MPTLMKRWFHKLRSWYKTIWPAIIWSAFVLILLIIPLESKTKESFFSIPHFDKAIHFILFMILSFLWKQYLESKSKSIRTGILGIVILSISYGVLIEYIQQYTGREFDPADMLANTLGVLCGVIIKKSRINI
jgi:VanZ family protein